ncbi:MAG: diguanylate cyclase [Eggerthellaceae bacterium]|nr:diguanylate cyclase [Eggerthellaceae bacterium]
MSSTSTAKHKVAVAASVIISLVLLSVTYAYLLFDNIQQERDRYGFIVENEADHIATTIDCVMARTSTLKALVQDHDGDPAFFRGVAGDVYKAVFEETGVSLKNLAIAPGGVVSDVYPLEGNESFVGFDLLDMSRVGNAEAKEAYDKGETVLTNPFELVQGGMGMAGRAPVLISEGDGQKLWGLVSVTIDFGNLIKVLNMGNLTSMGLNYSLSYIDDDGAAVPMDSQGDLGDQAIRIQFPVRNLTWELAVSPASGWVSSTWLFFAALVIVLISVLVGLFTHLYFKLRESNAKLLHISMVDRLTGCLNRRAYEDDLEEFRNEPPKESFVCASLDVNGLKAANDTLGHAAGDELLVGAAQCMKACFEPYGKLYRIGGDEFAALFFANPEQLETLKADLQESFDSWKGELVKTLSVSVGYVTRAEYPNETVLEMAKEADRRMYDAKRKYYESRE